MSERIRKDNKEIIQIYEKNIVHTIGGLSRRDALSPAGGTQEGTAAEETVGCADADNACADSFPNGCTNV